MVVAQIWWRLMRDEANSLLDDPERTVAMSRPLTLIPSLHRGFFLGAILLESVGVLTIRGCANAAAQAFRHFL
jgi:hypothetical protein